MVTVVALLLQLFYIFVGFHNKNMRGGGKAAQLTLSPSVVSSQTEPVLYLFL